jgi:hypothetical protein
MGKAYSTNWDLRDMHIGHWWESRRKKTIRKTRT